MGANIKYKDSVFSLLFSNPDLLRELYCALEDVNLPPDVPVKINTLQDVLFFDRINDISFEIGGKLVILIEHQSTINPNMALRLLMYIARVYEKIIEGRKVYTTKLIPLPRPEFFVLYNGTSPYPAETTLKLSDSFESVETIGLPEKGYPSLELSVKVVNINYGTNEKIVMKSKTLAGYSLFVQKVRENEKEGKDLKEAIKRAVNYCSENDILKEFLEQNATEVINMLITEWNMDDALAVRFEEGLEEGIGKGREEGREKGREEGREEIVRNALAKGIPPETIHTVTGLDVETIMKLASRSK